jgi:hypothetical protein
MHKQEANGSSSLTATEAILTALQKSEAVSLLMKADSPSQNARLKEKSRRISARNAQ